MKIRFLSLKLSRNLIFLKLVLRIQSFIIVFLIIVICLMLILSYSRFQDTIFVHSKIMGLNFSKCNNFLLSFNFEDCNVSNSIFSDMELKEIHFKNCKVNDCDFININLSDSSFENSNLKGTVFDNANLSNANFENAKEYSIDPNKNILRKAKFSFPEVVSLLDSFDIEIK